MNASRLTLLTIFGTLSSIILAPATAWADCPPGSWFCAEGEIKIGIPGQEQPPPQVQPAPPPVQPAPPPVVVQPAPPPMVQPAPPPPPVYAPQPYFPPPPRVMPPRQEPLLRYGISAGLDTGLTSGADGLIGANLGFRYRFNRMFLIELGIGYFSGNDSNGYHREEIPLTALGFLYLNPRSSTQFYLLGGLGYSVANVHNDAGWTIANPDYYGTTYTDYQESWHYLGVIFGAGVEFKVSRNISLFTDLRGFVRSRLDSGLPPEFVSSDGHTTNTSAGLLWNGGINFYF